MNNKFFTRILTSVSLGVCFVFLALMLLGVTGGVTPVLADTPVTSNITTNTTWDVAGSPYVISSAIHVQGTAVLTIEPGVVVSATDTMAHLVIDADAHLVAVGTSVAPITFVASSGQCTWQGLQLNSDDNEISYASFKYAKYAIKIEGTSDSNTLTFNTFQDNGGCSPEPDPLSGAIVGTSDSNIIRYNVFTNNNTAIYMGRSGGNEIGHNVISGTNKVALSLYHADVTRSADNNIISNTIRYAGEYGIFLIRGQGNTVRGNIVHDNVKGGIGLEDQILGVTIQSNDVYSNSGPGLYITDTTSAIMNMNDNLVWDNPRGVLWDSNVNNFISYGITRNVICRNTDYLFRNENSISVTAEANWWGTNNPTTGSVGSGGDIEGFVDIIPSIELTATPALSELPADGSSTTDLTIRLYGGGETVPERAQTITLTVNKGNLSQSTIHLNANGEGTVTYTAGISTGTVVVTVTDMCSSIPLTLNLQLTGADLAISKTPLITQVAPGGLISYTIHYTNQGNITATNVVITDILPANTTFNSASAPGFTLAASSPVWTRGILAAGQNGVITFTARVAMQSNLCVEGGLLLTNTARIDSATWDTDLSNNVYTTTSAQQISALCPDVTIYKYSAQAAVSPGDIVTYTIVYSNIGDAPAYGVGITDINPLDGSVQTLPGITPTLNPGARYSAVYTITADDSICNRLYLTNTAVISTVTPEIDYSNNIATTDSSNSPQVQCYNLAISKEPAYLLATPGQTVTYAIHYTNTSAISVANVVITDVLPQYTSFVNSNPPSSTSPGGVVTWNVTPNPLPGGANGVIMLTITISSAAPTPSIITNTVYIAGSGVETNTLDNRNVATIELQNLVDLSVLKNDNIGTGNVITTALAGSAISYTIQVRNGGSETATNVILTETLPTHTLFVEPTGANGWFQIGSSSVYTYRVPYAMPQYYSFEVDFIVSVDPNLPCDVHEVINVVRAGSGQTDINPNNNESVEQTPVECVPLQLSKTTPLTLTCPGDLVDYTITVSNNNTSALNNLTLLDSPDANTPFIGPPTWNNAGSGVYTYAVGTLNAGQQTSVAFSVWVTPGLSSAVTAITNEVTLNPAGLHASHTLPVYHDIPDLYTVKNDNIEILPRTLEAIARIERKTGPLPWLEALKAQPRAAQAHSVEPGDIISYSVSYGNAGPYTATNVRVLETLPENTQFWGPADPYWTHLSGNTYVYTVGNLAPGMGGLLEFRVRVNNPFPTGVPGVTNTVTIRGDEALECDSRNNTSVEFTPVLSQTLPQSSTVYLPIILKNWPPPDPVAQLSWLNQDNDHVSELDGGAGLAIDGRNDGSFSLTVDVFGYSRTIDWIELSSSQGGSARWNTTPGDSVIVAGVYLGGSQLNSGSGSVTRPLSNQETYTLYLSDDAGNTRFPCYPQQYNYAIIVHFDDGASATASASIQPCPPPDYPDWVSDLAVDPDTNQVFVASPRNHAVHVIDGAANVYNTSVGVDNQPTGLAVMTSTGKVAVAHFTTYDPTWQRGLWFIDTGSLSAHPMANQNGYVGVRPAKVAANSITGRFYVSNYDDRLAVVDGLWEILLGWVNKTYQRPYGLKFNQGSNILYNATIDTGELIVMDGFQAENPGYNPCHNPLPDTVSDAWNQADRRIQRMIAVNHNTGHIFVTSPPDPNPANGQNDSRVYVLDEAAFLAAIGGRPSAATCGAVLGMASQFESIRSIAAEPGVGWFPFYVDLGVANAGTEGIAVNPVTNKVYVTDTDGNRVFVFQDGDSGSLSLPPTAITGFERPMGIDVNPVTNKIYVANARTDSDPYGTVSVIDGASDTIIKTIPLN